MFGRLTENNIIVVENVSALNFEIASSQGNYLCSASRTSWNSRITNKVKRKNKEKKNQMNNSKMKETRITKK